MDQFVCVRIVQGWGMDLSLFQFNWQTSWMVFLMNADKTIYGRYGCSGGSTVAGLSKALEKALGFHKEYPKNKEEFAGKIGPTPPWKTPEEMPTIKGQGKTREARNSRGCIHCHNIHEGYVASSQREGKPLPARFKFPYPTASQVGLSLDLGTCATLKAVKPGTPAEQSEFQAGDTILRLAGQPILSVADVQWVLFTADDAATIPAIVDRGGKTVELTLALPNGWRTKK